MRGNWNFYRTIAVTRYAGRSFHRASSSSATAASSKGGRKYTLAQFPYPSGKLHMGHVRVYTISDALARMQRMQGYEVLHPMGFDSFGLPAENAARAHGVSPAAWTQQNISDMRAQLEGLNFSFDWDRSVSTCEPEYYKWTQSLFLDLHDAGLAYQADGEVNWDPVDETVLANEQVDSNGRSWRSGALVEKRMLKQWYFRITAFADELVDALDGLEGWPERVRTMQREWIGRSRGASVQFCIDETAWCVETFTTRPDTLYGVTFVALAPEHPLVDRIAAREGEHVQHAVSYLRAAGDEGTPVILGGARATVPLTDARVPIVVAPHVRFGYGTGAVMGVPAHDDRDAVVAKALQLPSISVVTDTGILQNSGLFSGMKAGEWETMQAVGRALSDAGCGRLTSTLRLRDWLVSRQRFWGAPIPMVHCDSCGTVPVPREELPIRLPDHPKVDAHRGVLPLAADAEWRACSCPSCGGPAQRETDTMDTFVDSSWYFLRYTDPHNRDAPFSRSKADAFMPVGTYIGGVEHAVLHLLYSRFIQRALARAGRVSVAEPFERLVTQGMVLGRAFRRASEGAYLGPSEAAAAAPGSVSEVWEKMSKSKFNGVDPGDAVAAHGADALRLFVLFMAPPEQDLAWDDTAIEGPKRFLQRAARFGKRLIEAPISQQLWDGEVDLDRTTHSAIARVTDAVERQFGFNAAIAELMKFLNVLERVPERFLGSRSVHEAFQSLALMLAPFAPSAAEDLFSTAMAARQDTSWSIVAFASDPSSSTRVASVHSQPWPVADDKKLRVSEKTVVVQIGGRKRCTVEVPSDLAGDALAQHVLSLAPVAKYVDGRVVRRAITPASANIVNFLLE